MQKIYVISIILVERIKKKHINRNFILSVFAHLHLTAVPLFQLLSNALKTKHIPKTDLSGL